MPYFLPVCLNSVSHYDSCVVNGYIIHLVEKDKRGSRMDMSIRHYSIPSCNAAACIEVWTF
jgi:hypothetical protein